MKATNAHSSFKAEHSQSIPTGTATLMHMDRKDWLGYGTIGMLYYVRSFASIGGLEFGYDQGVVSLPVRWLNGTALTCQL